MSGLAMVLGKEFRNTSKQPGIGHSASIQEVLDDYQILVHLGV